MTLENKQKIDVNYIEWKSLEMNVDLYKFSMDLAVKLNLFHYAVTGAILSFHFSKESPTVSILGLFFPILLSFIFGCLFLYATKLAMILRNDIRESAEKLGLRVYPECIILVALCYIFGMIMISIGGVLSGYLLISSTP